MGRKMGSYLLIHSLPIYWRRFMSAYLFSLQHFHLSLYFQSGGGITRPTVADSHDMDDIGEDDLQAALDSGKLW